MNLVTQNSPYYHLLKYLLFLLKHPVYANCILILHVFKLLYLFMIYAELAVTIFYIMDEHIIC